MANLLTPPPSVPSTLLATAKKKTTPVLPHFGFQQHSTSDHQHGLSQARAQNSFAEPIDRRTFMWGLVGVAMGINASDQNANAAQKRPPPPPPKEKQDPNVTGVLAKVLASKKRKEALKEAAAKLREKGKPIN
ncbi:hypothetical protein IFM89_025016 [Coptis chinensis]|uniref:Uncharacterized protein n=1 Tax=Coptis chinensis TaxID=261450 RepID=A0A835HXU2_9MAGN|nr:hypothetical protein IFM89_025016 [Coptis chinensis]